MYKNIKTKSIPYPKFVETSRKLEQVVESEFFKVLQKYVNFFYEIVKQIIKNPESTNDYKIKFDEVRLEFFDFLKNHNFAEVKGIYIRDDSGKLVFYYFNKNKLCCAFFETFLNFEKFLEFYKLKYKFNIGSTQYLVTYFPFLKRKFIDKVFQKPTHAISSNEVDSFGDICLVVDEKWKETKCSINHLIKKISRRTNDIVNKVISPERIEELSFALNDQTKNFVADAKCTVCQEKFKDGQYLSRMPCGHCFHKMCISKWFTNRRSESSESDNASIESSSTHSSDESCNESSSQEDEVDDLANLTRHVSLSSDDTETYNLSELFNSFEPFRNTDGNDSETSEHNEPESDKKSETQSEKDSESDSETSEHNEPESSKKSETQS